MRRNDGHETKWAKKANFLAFILLAIAGLYEPTPSLAGDIKLVGYDTSGIDRNYDRNYDARGFDRRFDRNFDRNFDRRGFDRRFDMNGRSKP
jgi:hypothetical protein